MKKKSTTGSRTSATKVGASRRGMRGRSFVFDTVYESIDPYTGHSVGEERNGEVVTVVEVFRPRPLTDDQDYLVKFDDGTRIGIWESELGEEVTTKRAAVKSVKKTAKKTVKRTARSSR
jgi:hypothetical protein